MQSPKRYLIGMEMQPYTHQSKFVAEFLGSRSAVTSFIAVAKDKRGPIDAFNLSLLFDEFGKVFVEIVTRIEVGSIQLG